MAQILVVEDEESLLQTLRYNLSRAGHDVRLSTNGLQALDMIRGNPPELVVLDLMLPGLDGLELCRSVRAETTNPAVAHVPILMLTARDEEIDKVVGLEVGADDYLTKPFSPRELVLRVQAIMRRGRSMKAADSSRSFGNGEMMIDEERRQVTVRGAPVELTPTEWGVLSALARNPGRVYSRYELINRVRGYEFDGYERVIDSHVKNLRRKIELDPRKPLLVRTLLGGGYRLGVSRDG
jgi:DNA-binding response OmpR family regulator